jgi:hypothetical protein
VVVGRGLVVAYTATMLADPGEGSLGDPHPGSDMEPAGPRQPLDDLDWQVEYVQ